jgi:steroid delta-isomerase-like uncharacterized protein
MSEDLARESIEAYNDGDWERARAVLTDDSVYDEPGTGRRVEGFDAIIELFQGWKSALPDSHGTVGDVFTCGDRVALQVTWEGTHDGSLPIPGGEIPATGRSMSVRACQVLRISNGKIAESCQYFDMLGMLEQLGAVSSEALAQH